MIGTLLVVTFSLLAPMGPPVPPGFARQVELLETGDEHRRGSAAIFLLQLGEDHLHRWYPPAKADPHGIRALVTRVRARKRVSAETAMVAWIAAAREARTPKERESALLALSYHLFDGETACAPRYRSCRRIAIPARWRGRAAAALRALGDRRALAPMLQALRHRVRPSLVEPARGPGWRWPRRSDPRPILRHLAALAGVSPPTALREPDARTAWWVAWWDKTGRARHPDAAAWWGRHADRAAARGFLSR